MTDSDIMKSGLFWIQILYIFCAIVYKRTQYIDKTGGLGDVVGALPKALKAHGVDVRVVIPLYSMIDYTKGENTWDEVLIKKVSDHLDLIPSNVNISGLEVELLDFENKEYVLRDVLKEHTDKYNYVILDCPPSLSILTINALCAADSVIVPIQCEYYALEGLSQLTYTINLVRERLNEKLEIEGIVFTMFDVRNRLSQQVVQNVKDNLDQPIFKTIIPRNVRLAEAPSYGMPIITYDSRSAGAVSYRKLAKELIRRTK